jgi:hypothetical protein
MDVILKTADALHVLPVSPEVQGIHIPCFATRPQVADRAESLQIMKDSSTILLNKRSVLQRGANNHSQ